MKKILFIAAAMMLAAGLLYSEDILWGSMYEPGNVRIFADAAIEGSGTDTQIAVFPGAELLLWKPLIGQAAFIDAGVAAAGRFGIPISAGSSLSIGAGLMGSLHFGFRGLDLPWNEYLQGVDLYAEAGIKLDFVTSSQMAGLALKTGVNYFLNDNITAGVFYSNWGSYNGAGISVSLKIGKKPEVKGIEFEYDDEVSAFAVQPYLLQFYTLFYAAHFAGGVYPENWQEGQAAVQRVSVIDSAGTDSYYIKRALLKNLSGGRKLWSMEYYDDQDVFYYEFITDSNYNVEVIYYDSEDEGVISIKADAAVNPEAEYLTWQDYDADGINNVEIKVEAGTFITTEYSYTDETGIDIKWWLSEDVPGSLVSYKMEDDSDIVISELVEISSGASYLYYQDQQ